jgi:hypothetical protein
MRRIDTEPATSSWLSVTIYGRSGAGKTTLAVTAPKPLICLSEMQGIVIVRQAAARLGVPMPTVLHMQSVDDYRAVVRALHGSKAEPFRVHEVVDGLNGKRERKLVLELPAAEWPETVVLDSVTDAMRLIVEEIRTQSPPTLGKDGLPVDSQRFWGVLEDRARNLIQSFRDVPLHKLFLCLSDDRMVGEEGDQKRSVGPDLPMRKLPERLSAASNMVGFLYRREKLEMAKDAKLGAKPIAKTVYGVMTEGPEHMLLKAHPPIRKFEVPSFARWVAMVRGELKVLEAAPAPSGESASAQEEAPAADQPAAEQPAAVAATEPKPEPEVQPAEAEASKAPEAAADAAAEPSTDLEKVTGAPATWPEEEDDPAPAEAKPKAASKPRGGKKGDKAKAAEGAT